MNADIDQGRYPELDYFKNTNKIDFLIDSIHQNWDIFFIKLANGDIFQLYYMMDSIESPQRLSIFETGSDFYDQAVDRLRYAELYEVEKCEYESIADWLNR